MSFSCTVGLVVNHVVATLAVSDKVSLETLWVIASQQAGGAPLDSFQKSIVWRGLTAASSTPLVSVHLPSGQVLPLAAIDYEDISQHGGEIFLCPTEECQFRYLTNTEDYQALKVSLGELPFQLLVVIARHGPAGILNPDLSRESGQDARSLRLRLQKLETFGLILCRNVYINKKHTTHSVLVKFADSTWHASDSADAEEDLDSSRDVAKLKRLIVAALKSAPNQLRGFSDLKKEFKLHGSHSASKFFRSVCFKLHQSGYVEKLHVELPETNQRVYAIRFIKDLPSDSDDIYEILDPKAGDNEDFGDSEDEDADDISDSASKIYFPLLNQVFPLFHQIFSQVYTRGDHGITSGEIAKNLMGTGDYRPLVRLCESLPSYLSNSKTLKPFKKYAEPYDEWSVSKLYENEGKLKFYKYFVTQFCSEDKPVPKAYNFTPKSSVTSLVALNKKLHSSLGKTSNESLIEKKRRMLQASDPGVKRPKVIKKEHDVINQIEDFEKQPRVRRAKAPTSFLREEAMEIDNESEEEYHPQTDAEIAQSAIKAEAKEANYSTLSANDLPTFVVAPKTDKKRKPQANAHKAENSLKSITRRNHLMDIIRENGGAVFKSASLCRKLDERLQTTTLTDTKTLARDIAFLTKSGEIEEQKISVELEDKALEKKILVLKKVHEQPSEQKIVELGNTYATKMSRKNMKIFKRRVIQSDLKLYIEAPIVKKLPKTTRRRRGKNRLSALGDQDEIGEQGGAEGGLANDSSLSGKADFFSNLKKSRRAKRVVSSQTSDVAVSTGKRARRNIRLERADATTLYRCVVISKAFSKSAIDFDNIAEFFEDLDGKLVKQKWGTLRRSFGGAKAVSKGVETFQNMVLQGVEDGNITEQDLVEGSLGFFLDFWREFDPNTELYVPDEMPLYTTYDSNKETYVIQEHTNEGQSTLAEKIEDISMRQKESVLSQINFTYQENAQLVGNADDELRSILKSIFSTEEGSFDPNIVKTILGKYGEDAVRMATDGLLQDKEILYVSFEGATKFILSDRFKNTLEQKHLTAKFFHQAAFFKNVLNDISSANKGLILSQGIHPGEIAALLEMISENLIDLTRIDRTFNFENYESRLIDKEQIACDIVVQSISSAMESLKPSPANVPFSGPCQPIWVDLNANINKDLWKKIITTLLYHIVFKPGLPDSQLHERMQTVLSVPDFYSALEWLTESRCIRKCEEGGYVASNCWQFILGY